MKGNNHEEQITDYFCFTRSTIFIIRTVPCQGFPDYDGINTGETTGHTLCISSLDNFDSTGDQHHCSITYL